MAYVCGSVINDASVVTVQIFDQKKFKVCCHTAFTFSSCLLAVQRRDQGFLGVINIRPANVIDFELGGDGPFSA